ncbi:cytidylate kinase family protein [Candidatus Woesearchaeota archaeon]|nr:cytidylate kinase family protein [Candidatus Woesearchaeota archaeon]
MPVIAISGQPGTGSSTVGRLLAENLRLRFFSVGEYQKSIISGANETDRAMNFWKAESSKKKKTHEQIEKMQEKEAAKGDVVVEGKLSVHFLRELSDFKVWLKAPIEIRAARTAQRDGISANEAMDMLRKREEEQRTTWKKVYGFDYTRQEQDADLVVDSSGKPPEKVVAEIISEMRERGVI